MAQSFGPVKITEAQKQIAIARRLECEGTKHYNANRNRKAAKKLDRRRADYAAMISQNKIGDGHREANGYHRPGSNK